MKRLIINQTDVYFVFVYSIDFLNFYQRVTECVHKKMSVQMMETMSHSSTSKLSHNVFSSSIASNQVMNSFRVMLFEHKSIDNKHMKASHDKNSPNCTQILMCIAHKYNRRDIFVIYTVFLLSFIFYFIYVCR